MLENTQVLKCEDELRVDLLESILQYSPAARPSATTMLAHMYFDELRDERVHE